MSLPSVETGAAPVTPAWEFDGEWPRLREAVAAYNALGDFPERGNTYQAGVVPKLLLEQSRILIPHNDAKKAYRAEKAFEDRMGNCMSYHEALAAIATSTSLEGLVGEWDQSKGHATSGLFCGNAGWEIDGYNKRCLWQMPGYEDTNLPATLRLKAWRTALEEDRAVFMWRFRDDGWETHNSSPAEIGDVELPDDILEFRIALPAARAVTMFACMGDYRHIINNPGNAEDEAKLPVLEKFISEPYHLISRKRKPSIKPASPVSMRTIAGAIS